MDWLIAELKQQRQENEEWHDELEMAVAEICRLERENLRLRPTEPDDRVDPSGGRLGL